LVKLVRLLVMGGIRESCPVGNPDKVIDLSFY
jgi:hypothetical protein